MKLKEKVFEVPKYKGACIYAIVNIEDLKIYVGSTKNAQKRARNHEYCIRNRQHVVKEINEDAEKRFDFVILQKVSSDTQTWLLHVLEKMFMLVISSNGWKLYNVQPKCVGDYRGMCVDIAQTFVGENNTRNKFEKSFKQKFGIDSWIIKAMKPSNRIKAIAEDMKGE